MNIRTILKGFGRFAKRNSTKIFAGVAIGAEMLGFWFMHKEAPIVKERLEELDENATWIDKVKAAGPVYLPAFGMLLLSSGCIIGGCVTGEKKVALLSSLYSASETALMQYEEAVVKKLGKEKAQEIQDEVAQDVIRKAQPCEVNVIATGKGDQLFFEPLTARTFTSSKLNVEAAVNRINKQIFSELWVSANDWFYELGLTEPAGLGDLVGWNADHMLSINFTPGVTENDRSCFVIGYPNRPVLYK